MPSTISMCKHHETNLEPLERHFISHVSISQRYFCKRQLSAPISSQPPIISPFSSQHDFETHLSTARPKPEKFSNSTEKSKLVNYRLHIFQVLPSPVSPRRTRTRHALTTLNAPAAHAHKRSNLRISDSRRDRVSTSEAVTHLTFRRPIMIGNVLRARV